MIENINKEQLNVNKLIGQKKKNIYVEGNVIVPDVKPDVLNIVNTNGNSYIYKSEIINNNVKVDGNVNLYLIYLAVNGENRSLNTILDFSENFDFDSLNQDLKIEENVVIKSIETKILNERKINVRVLLDVEVKIFCSEKIEFINNFEEFDEIKVLAENVNIMTLKGSGTARASAKENIAIDVIDEIAEIFKVNISITNTETKTSYNKILAKSDVFVKILYLTEDNRISSVEKSIPLMGFVDIQNISDDDICISKYFLRNMIATPNPKDEHSIYFDIDYEVSADIYENKSVRVVKDLYSIKNDIKYDSKSARLIKSTDNYKKIFQIRDIFNINDLDNICDTSYNAYIINKKVYDNKINIEGEIEVEFLYESNASNNLNSRTIKMSFNQSLEWNNDNSNIDINITDSNFIVNPNGDVEGIFEMECYLKNDTDVELNLIENVEVEESNNEQTYSMVIYFVKPKDSLWTIAKQFKSTIDDIKLINNIDDNSSLRPGDKLYITRCK